MRTFLHKNAPDLSDYEENRITKEVLSLLEQKNFQAIFSNNSRAEVPLMGMVNGRIISGQIDRLIVEKERVMIVDLPGYGYAKAPESMVKQWQKMIFAYLQGRVNLKRVFLLIDSRHGIKKVDRDIMELLDKAAVTYQIVLTKSDKISSSAQVAVIKRTQEEIGKHAAAYPDIVITSSEKGEGIDELRAEICRLGGLLSV